MATFISADTYSGYSLPYLEVRLRRARLGLGVGLLGIVMVFVSFTSAYVVRQGLPTLDPRTNTLARDWLPMPLPALLFVNTGLLLLSSVTMELARRLVRRDILLTRAPSVPGVSARRERTFFWLALTVVLGVSFLRGQWIVWGQLAASGFYLATSPSSSFVYLLTGTHGVHLLGGILALLAAGAILLFCRQVESRVVVLDVTAWYWHFMALLWIYILCLLEIAR
jgi:Heme/copper-type cytochrome/quinol oxidase, subunit 3